MKVKILLIFIALTFFSGTADLLGQKKKDPRLQSGKNLRNTLLTMIRQAKDGPAKKYECDIRGLLKSVPRKNLVPSAAQLKKEIGHIVDDSLKAPFWRKFNTYGRVLDAFHKTEKRDEFLTKIGYGPNAYPPGHDKDLDRFYYGYRKAQKSGFSIDKRSFKQGECTVHIETVLLPKKVSWDLNNMRISKVDWEISMSVSIDCPCTKNNKYRVKSAKYRYTADTDGLLMFNIPYDRYTGKDTQVKFGLRFNKVKDSKLGYLYMDCCKDSIQDGSFVDPNENINDKNTLLDTGLGIGFGSEVETNIGFSGGVLFNVTEIGGNPLYVGPKATVSTTSITSDAIKELKILIGPTAEYQIPLNSGNVNIVTGVNSGYTFGNVDVAGFEQDFSGITVNTYAGAQFNVGNNLAITALLNFLEFSSLKFKSDTDNFENTASNTTFLPVGGAINVGVRIGLD